MHTSLTTRSTALGLAVLATLALMAGIHGLALPSAPDASTLAQGGSPVQVVVITGQRAPRS